VVRRRANLRRTVAEEKLKFIDCHLVHYALRRKMAAVIKTEKSSVSVVWISFVSVISYPTLTKVPEFSVFSFDFGSGHGIDNSIKLNMMMLTTS
jgi:hypothetical protein